MDGKDTNLRDRITYNENEAVSRALQKLDTAVHRGESVLIGGIPEEEVLAFMKKNKLSDGFQIITAEELLSADTDVLGEKGKIIITGANDLSNENLQRKLFRLRGMIESGAQILLVIISEHGSKPGISPKSPFTNFTTNIFPE